MSRQKEIIVEIATDGSVTIEGQGFTGASCDKATKFLEVALGTVNSRKRKPEYTQREPNALRQGAR